MGKRTLTFREWVEEQGGTVSVAKALGHAHHTSVQYWAKVNKVPIWRRPEIEALARDLSVPAPRMQP